MNNSNNNNSIPFIKNNSTQLNDTSVQFCPACNNLMKYIINNDTGIWTCTVCMYTMTANRFIVTLPETQPDNEDYSLYPDDPSLKRITRTCPYCNKNTEMVIFYGKEKTMTNNYVCTLCRNVLCIE